MLISQSINYVEGKAPEWTRDEGQVFYSSLNDSGFPPNGLPVREVAQNGSAAWTLRRSIYAVLVDLPFAGLADFLTRAASAKGPIRRLSDEELGIGMTPIVIPATFEYQVSDLHVWDRQETTRFVGMNGQPNQNAPKPCPACRVAMQQIRHDDRIVSLRAMQHDHRAFRFD